jgi:hypothetical protein
MKSARHLLGFVLVVFIFAAMSAEAEAAIRVKVAAIVASNEGSEFDLVNDNYRDELIKLFSYTEYHQKMEELIHLEPGQDEVLEIPGEYSLTLNLKGGEGNVKQIQARIEKDGKSYLDTQVSVLGSESGDLILVVETGT